MVKWTPRNRNYERQLTTDELEKEPLGERNTTAQYQLSLKRIQPTIELEAMLETCETEGANIEFQDGTVAH